MNLTETGPGELRVFKMMSELMDARLWGQCRTGRSGGSTGCRPGRIKAAAREVQRSCVC